MTDPVFTPVATSSNIHSIAHDGKALYVRFKNGNTYRYANASKDHHDAMLSAKSPGSYFYDRIKHFHDGEKL